MRNSRVLLAFVLLGAGCELLVHFDPPPEGGAQCSDRLDNDGNGLIDCRDPGCAAAAVCAGPGICSDGVINPPRAALAAPTAAAVAGAPSLLAVADLTGDGQADVVVGVPGITGSQVVVLRGAGGTLAAQTPVTVAGHIAALAAGDLNGDGRPDVIVVDDGSGSVTPLFSGDGTLVVGQPVRAGSAPAGVALLDLDGDGALDVAVANRGDGTVTLLRNIGEGGFRAGPHAGGRGRRRRDRQRRPRRRRQP